MPAPVRRTVLVTPLSWGAVPRRWWEGGAVRKVVRAWIAPVVVVAVRGIIVGGGRAPVYGTLRRLLGMGMHCLG